MYRKLLALGGGANLGASDVAAARQELTALGDVGDIGAALEPPPAPPTPLVWVWLPSGLALAGLGAVASAGRVAAAATVAGRRTRPIIPSCSRRSPTSSAACATSSSSTASSPSATPCARWRPGRSRTRSGASCWRGSTAASRWRWRGPGTSARSCARSGRASTWCARIRRSSRPGAPSTSSPAPRRALQRGDREAAARVLDAHAAAARVRRRARRA